MKKLKLNQIVIINTNPDYLMSIGYKRDNRFFLHPEQDSITPDMLDLNGKISNVKIVSSNNYIKNTHYRLALDKERYNWPEKTLFPIDSEYGKFLYGT